MEIRPIPPLSSNSLRFFPTCQLRRDGFKQAIPIHLAGRGNIFFGVCPRYRPGGKAADVSAAVSLWADLDRGLPESWPENIPQPSILVETSPERFQGYWLLEEPTADLDYVERLVKGLALLLNGDRVADRARVLRLPGFPNMKYQDHPVAKVVSLDEEMRFRLTDFASVLPGLDAAVSNQVGGPGPQRNELVDFQGDIDINSSELTGPLGFHRRFDNASLRKLIMATYGEGDRTHTTTSLVGVLRSRGVSCESAVAFMAEWQQAHFSPPQDDSELTERVINMFTRYGQPDVSKHGKGEAFLRRVRSCLRGEATALAPSGAYFDPYSNSKEGSRVEGDYLSPTLTDENVKAMANSVDIGVHVGGVEGHPLDEVEDDADISKFAPRERSGLQKQKYFRRVLPASTVFRLTPPTSGNTVEVAQEGDEEAAITRGIAMAESQPEMNKYRLLEWLKPLGDGEDGAALMHAYQRLANCGVPHKQTCDDHGNVRKYRAQCALPWHPNVCLSKTADNIAALVLPQDNVVGWREVWLVRQFGPGDMEKRGGPSGVIDAFIRESGPVIHRFAQRVKVKERLLARAYGWDVQQDCATALLRLTFAEREKGEGTMIAREIGEQIGADIIVNRFYTSWLLALAQLMYNASSVLFGCGGGDIELFRSWLAATRRHDHFHIFGPMYKAYQDVRADLDAERKERADDIVEDRCPVEGCGALLRTWRKPDWGPDKGDWIEVTRWKNPHYKRRKEKRISERRKALGYGG